MRWGVASLRLWYVQIRDLEGEKNGYDGDFVVLAEGPEEARSKCARAVCHRWGIDCDDPVFASSVNAIDGSEPWEIP